MENVRPNIVVLDGHTLNPGDNPWDELDQLGQLTIHDRTDPADVLERSTGAEVLVINKIRLTADILNALPDLRLIAVTATGYDCVDVKAAAARGISVVNVPVYGTHSVAQLTIAHLLHACHRIDLHDRAVKEGQWQREANFSFWLMPLHELQGRTMGIVGLGRIGRQVATIASALGMHILATSRSRRDPPPLPQFAWADLRDLCEQSDVISLHCPATPDTVGLIRAETLAWMRPTALLINVSRGTLIVEQDLADALNAGRLAGAALDVVATEPIPADSPLLTARNCWITPHLAWATVEARQRLMQQTVENIRAFLGGTPRNVVTPPRAN
ncbi:MAG: D-2-hydroxyacid dehydrogenase [Pirellulales bacterium]